MGSTIFWDDFSFEGGGNLPKIVINLPGTYEKLLCKGEPYWFSIQHLARYFGTFTPTHGDSVTFVKGYFDYYLHRYKIIRFLFF